jgi:hypothetical protein
MAKPGGEVNLLFAKVLQSTPRVDNLLQGRLSAQETIKVQSFLPFFQFFLNLASLP